MRKTKPELHCRQELGLCVPYWVAKTTVLADWLTRMVTDDPSWQEHDLDLRDDRVRRSRAHSADAMPSAAITVTVALIAITMKRRYGGGVCSVVPPRR